MVGRLDGRTVVVLLGEGFEDLEFWVPVMRLREEGATVTVAGLVPGVPVTGKNGLVTEAEVAIDDVDAEPLDALLVPGGWAPDKLRRYPSVTSLVKRVHDRGAIVGMICHAGLIGISAGIVAGGPRACEGAIPRRWQRWSDGWMVARWWSSWARASRTSSSGFR